MAWFEKKKSESIEVGEFVDMLASAKNNRERRKLLYHDGVKKKFNLTPKDLKQAEKLSERMTQGEKGVAAFAAGFGDMIKGRQTSNNSSYTKLIKEQAKKADHGKKPSSPNYLGLSGKPSAPMHPAEYARRVRNGEQAVSIQQALHIKGTDPKTYEAILHREAKRQGLI